jgi:WD40 repeat protein
MQASQKLIGHQAAVTKLCFVGNNKLVSIDKKSNVIVWNIQNQTILKRLPNVHDEAVSVVTNKNGRYLFVGTTLGYVIVYDLETFDILTPKYLKFDSAITAMYFDDYNAPKNQDNISNNLISFPPVTLCHIF